MPPPERKKEPSVSPERAKQRQIQFGTVFSFVDVPLPGNPTEAVIIEVDAESRWISVCGIQQNPETNKLSFEPPGTHGFDDIGTIHDVLPLATIIAGLTETLGKMNPLLVKKLEKRAQQPPIILP